MNTSVLDVVLGIFAIVLFVAFFLLVIKASGWIFTKVGFVIRWVSTPFMCWVLGRHDYEVIDRRENSDHWHVDLKCRFCGKDVSEQKL